MSVVDEHFRLREAVLKTVMQFSIGPRRGGLSAATFPPAFDQAMDDYYDFVVIGCRAALRPALDRAQTWIRAAMSQTHASSGDSDHSEPIDQCAAPFCTSARAALRDETRASSTEEGEG